MAHTKEALFPPCKVIALCQLFPPVPAQCLFSISQGCPIQAQQWTLIYFGEALHWCFSDKAYFTQNWPPASCVWTKHWQMTADCRAFGMGGGNAVIFPNLSYCISCPGFPCYRVSFCVTAIFIETTATAWPIYDSENFSKLNKWCLALARQTDCRMERSLVQAFWKHQAYTVGPSVQNLHIAAFNKTEWYSFLFFIHVSNILMDSCWYYLRWAWLCCGGPWKLC